MVANALSAASSITRLHGDSYQDRGSHCRPKSLLVDLPTEGEVGGTQAELQKLHHLTHTEASTILQPHVILESALRYFCKSLLSLCPTYHKNSVEAIRVNNIIHTKYNVLCKIAVHIALLCTHLHYITTNNMSAVSVSLLW